ncbi:dihydrodipicolinate reductase [bacterium]|nr:dihydrodipicolinate reductase [bacterium]
MSAIHLLLSGLPGRMANEVALAALESAAAERFTLLDVALTGEVVNDAVHVVSGREIQLRRPSTRESLELPPNTIAVDFTEPTAALDNVRFFASAGIPFVMGTTGFDRDEAVKLVQASDASAVIAPNMAIPIVLLQTAMANLADNFPGAMKGYGFHVVESHQKGKKDTSGTAKALVADFARLGLPAKVDEIEMIREPEEQTSRMNVPAEHLAGHAYHYYDIKSSNGSVRLGLNHCVDGRRVYAEGALVAADFLARRLAEGSRGEVFNMTDVLMDQG